MPRKPSLEGGKREEILNAAQELFFTEGFEATSVRKILQRVGGEVGMFYHYFSSKEELFDAVVDRFFRQYGEDFEKLALKASSPEELFDALLPFYEAGMEKYRHMEGAMHWTIRLALHERTLLSMVPAVEGLLIRWGYGGAYPMDMAAAKLVADFSATLHSQSFSQMGEEEKKAILLRQITDTLS